MVDVVDTSPTGQQVGHLLESSLSQALDGVELSYRVLEHVAALHQVPSAWMVLRPALLGPQVFLRGRRAATPSTVSQLLARPPGVYTEPDIGDHTMSGALAGTCNLVLSAQAAQLSASVDGASGLASRAVTEAALARAAAQSARHGWSHTFVLLATAPTVTAQRWEAFCAALRTSLRHGDEAGVVAGRQIMAMLGNAETDVARPFLSRLRAAMEHRGVADVEFAVATARAPDESVDPKELWRLLDERLALPGQGPAPDVGAQPQGLSGPMELDLRSLPGVVSVGLTSGSAATGANFQLTVVTVEPQDTLRLEVTRVLGDHLAGTTVNIVAAAAPQQPSGAWLPESAPAPAPAAPLPPEPPASSAPVADPPANGRAPSAHSFTPAHGDEPLNGNGRLAPPPDQRVTLLTVRFDPDTGVSQVDLAYGTARGSGRATAGPLAGGAQATLEALEALGLDVPFYVVSAERAAGIMGEPVVVVVAPRRSEGDRTATPGRRQPSRIGAAEGSEPVEAASRATLAALNRFLTQGKKAPPA
jgi:hypothetical protein